MGYFDFLTAKSFKTAPAGERVFCPSGPWARPYVIPDDATEQRLFVRQRWLMRGMLGFFVLVQPFLFALIPDVTREPLPFVTYLLAVAVLFWLASYVTLRKELRPLARLSSALPLGSFFDMAGLGAGALSLGLACCLGFIAIGVWMVLTNRNPFIGWTCIALFAVTAVPWGRAILLQRFRPPGASVGPDAASAATLVGLEPASQGNDRLGG